MINYVLMCAGLAISALALSLWAKLSEDLGGWRIFDDGRR